MNGRFSDEAPHFKSPCTGVRDERWRELESLSFKRFFQWYTLKFESGSVYRAV